MDDTTLAALTEDGAVREMDFELISRLTERTMDEPNHGIRVPL
jgi:hypothetical protein